jgi:hypothetical protein
MAKVAHQNDRVEKSAADQDLDQAARAAGAAAVAETDRLARSATDRKPEAAATTVLEILTDHTRHAIEATAALDRARSLTEIAQVQSDFLGGSLARMGRLNERSLDVLRNGMMSLSTRR